jgi:hypothetical protein
MPVVTVSTLGGDDGCDGDGDDVVGERRRVAAAVGGGLVMAVVMCFVTTL